MNVRSSYREAAVRGASPVRLVICLYEQAIEDLRRAVAALEKKDIAARTRAINHALMVIGQLQGTLDMERGGDVATNLLRFYTMIRAGLIEAQFRQSVSIVEQKMAQLVTVHGAWLEAERTTSEPAAASQTEAELSMARVLENPAERSASDWNA
jgi:flagellar secretion chaperone FliS